MKPMAHHAGLTVAAHRGDSYNAYENTMPAFELAVKNGSDMIETDVRLSKDEVLVLIHDDKVDRTTNGNGLVRDFTLAELKKLNAGIATDPAEIPTFEEFLQWLAPQKTMLNIEIKEYYTPGNEERCDRCIDAVVAMIEKYDMLDRTVFNSFDAHVLQYIFEKYGPEYRLHGFYPYSIMSNVDRNPDEYLYCACIFADTKKEHYDYLISRGIEPWVGAGIKVESHLKLCCEYGAKLVTTNYPADSIAKAEHAGIR